MTPCLSGTPGSLGPLGPTDTLDFCESRTSKPLDCLIGFSSHLISYPLIPTTQSVYKMSLHKRVKGLFTMPWNLLNPLSLQDIAYVLSSVILPGYNEDHSPTVFSGICNVFCNVSSRCEITLMITYFKSTLFQETNYFFPNKFLITLTEKGNKSVE